MKFLPILLFVAAIFVAVSNGGSPSEPKVCDVVQEVVYEFDEFTSTILRQHVLNLPRSDDSILEDKERKLEDLLEIIKQHVEIPNEDKEKLEKLCRKQNDVSERAWFDLLTHAHIWDCFVAIFNEELNNV